MHDQEQPHSGSRWEPSPAPSSGEAQENARETASLNAAGTVGEEPPVPPVWPEAASVPTGTAAAVPVADPAAKAAKTARLRRQGLFAAAVAGLLLAGGAGGFAIGHATAGTGGTAGTGIERQRGGHPGFDRDGDGDGYGGRGFPGADDGGFGNGVPPDFDGDRNGGDRHRSGSTGPTTTRQSA
ncbi:hypothetical protein FNH05_33025 [Amycolatopsis rhizosphaerae]|uniref:Uncharacterized protein n=1 Tax=Amycolatopsis rhizosphaerae TaxID=2053003 RepID=A0A558AGM8_9PSEU|nr:hypothetical protein [Amycolatopsis rhizosphaerae]TVT23413.1 hypothetical protein FNH05_33025 [Amycolatopsis rhizosphaerae]